MASVKPISGLMLGLAALLIAGSPAAETSYPKRPLRMILGVPPGIQPDTIARILNQRLYEAWGKPVVIDNATGIAGSIAAQRVAAAKPDRYTFGLMSKSQIVVNPSLYKLGYHPVRDFAPVSELATSPNILVARNGLPATNLHEFVALAQSKPGTLTFASGGTGSGPHMAAELLKSQAGIDIRHIPYKGRNAAIPDVIGGRVTMIFLPTATALPLVRDGKLRVLAVTSSRRPSAAPELPTVAESGYPGFEFTNWFGILAPARTPATIIGKLHGEIVKALSLPGVRTRFTGLGLDPIASSPDDFAAVIKSELPRWERVIHESGMKPN